MRFNGADRTVGEALRLVAGGPAGVAVPAAPGPHGPECAVVEPGVDVSRLARRRRRPAADPGAPAVMGCGPAAGLFLPARGLAVIMTAGHAHVRHAAHLPPDSRTLGEGAR